MTSTCTTCQTSPGHHAGLHVGHVWTNVQCPAYRTLNGADCTCNACRVCNGSDADCKWHA